MFQFQGVVFIAVLCAANAAVTVNIYKDDLETVEAKVHEVKSCDAAWCERTCRLLGFTSGICAGDICKCFNHKEDDLETVEIKVHEVKSCDAAWCERTCRLLGFTSGICAGDTCRCFNHKDEQIEQNDISSLDEDVRGNGLSGCDPNACDQLCRRLKFPSGMCINGRCKCDNFRREPEQIEQNDIPSLDEDVRGNGLSGCDPNACDQLCRRLKFPSGTCINGRCKCDNFRREPEQIEQNNIPSLDEDVRGNGLSGCDPNACDRLCRRLKFPSGTCINGRCKCDNFRREPDFEIFWDQGVKETIGNSVEPNYVDKVATMAIKDCDQLACMMGCQELGFPGGSCFLGKCRCNKRGKEEENKRSLISVTENCNSVTCNMMCLRLKYYGGWCRFDTCECF